MKISTKGRYALASMICMAQNYSSGEYITVISIAERLGISKIYLEQVYSLMKRAGLVNSIKGAQGGYQLARAPGEMTAFDILSAVELSLFEKPDDGYLTQEPKMEETIKSSVLTSLGEAIEVVLKGVTLQQLLDDFASRQEQGFMYYI